MAYSPSWRYKKNKTARPGCFSRLPCTVPYLRGHVCTRAGAVFKCVKSLRRVRTSFKLLRALRFQTDFTWHVRGITRPRRSDPWKAFWNRRTLTKGFEKTNQRSQLVTEHPVCSLLCCHSATFSYSLFFRMVRRIVCLYSDQWLWITVDPATRVTGMRENIKAVLWPQQVSSLWNLSCS